MDVHDQYIPGHHHDETAAATCQSIWQLKCRSRHELFKFDNKCILLKIMCNLGNFLNNRFQGLKTIYHNLDHACMIYHNLDHAGMIYHKRYHDADT
jgi:hypothetical protein